MGADVEDDHPTGRRGEARFTIKDAMAMVAAVAVGIALARSYHEELISVAGPQGRSFHYQAGAYMATLVVVPFAAALAWCRLRRPFRPIRRLAREPGTVALLAIAVCIVAAVLEEALIWALLVLAGTRIIGLVWRPLVDAAASLAGMIGPAVCASWSLQCLAGHWRPQPGWIDRAGRALGTIGIILFALHPWFLWFLLNLWP
jgi:hypothetical protein